MKLVIDIDENLYTRLFDNGDEYVADMRRACVSIRKGIPLPKMYGDLVDRDKINSRFNAIYDELVSLSCQPTYKELLDKLSMCLDTAEPVIKENYEETEEDLWK